VDLARGLPDQEQAASQQDDVAPGEGQVDHRVAVGHGWQSPVLTRERVSSDPLELRTLALSAADWRWTREMPPGDYDVHVICGDANFPQGPHRVSANGKPLVEDVSTARGEFIERTARVPVRNGRLDVHIGTGYSYTMINLLEVSLASDATRGAIAAPLLRSFNFQPQGSEVPLGFQPDHGALFDPERGSGWSTPVETVEQGAPVPQVLDTFARSWESATWEVAVPQPGFYEVWLAVGDPSAPAGYAPFNVAAVGKLTCA